MCLASQVFFFKALASIKSHISNLFFYEFLRDLQNDYFVRSLSGSIDYFVRSLSGSIHTEVSL